MRTHRNLGWGALLAALVLGVGWIGYTELYAQGDKPKSTRETMRKKLGAAQDVLEGLSMDDLELVAKSAKTLKELAASAEMKVHVDSMYQQHSTEFRRIAEKLEKAANEKNRDAAALAYVGLTLNCMECHRYVRDVLIAR